MLCELASDFGCCVCINIKAGIPLRRLIAYSRDRRCVRGSGTWKYNSHKVSGKAVELLDVTSLMG